MAMLIKNCRLISNGQEIFKNILIKNGKIKKITEEEPKANTVVDVNHNYVLPGIIDPHVHFRDPGFEYKEDFFTGSVAAAAGGITTVLDMPNTDPPTITIKNLNGKRKIARKSIVNYGFHFGAASDNINEIKKAKNKTASTKLFMNLSTGKMMIEDNSIISEVFSCSKIVAVHAEKDKVAEAMAYAKKTGTPLYLCHISLKDEIKTIKKYRNKKMFVEVTPHHLFLDKSDFKKQKGFADMKPSLKSRQDVEALWDAIDEGIVDTIGTDHAPHTKEEKTRKDYPHGVPGCETALPLMLDAVNKEMISLTKVVKLMSTNPARIFGLKNKGKIAEGYDADLIIVDMEKKKKVIGSKLYTKCKWSPFEGKLLKGWPVMTIVGGNIVFDETGFYDIKAREVVFNG